MLLQFLGYHGAGVVCLSGITVVSVSGVVVSSVGGRYEVIQRGRPISGRSDLTACAYACAPAVLG